ncbi:hypothetical protein [Pseudoleptotrichia goodfellowii]|nr:hypothetical protein [Pseudoleptotrichia goodfellowii]
MKQILKNKYLMKVFVGFVLLFLLRTIGVKFFTPTVVEWVVLEEIIKNILIFIISFFIKEDEKFKKEENTIKGICIFVLFYIIMRAVIIGSIM